MAVKNSTILASSWLSGSNDFQQRVPDPTQANISSVVDSIFDPANNDLYNSWSAGLINRIGMTIIDNKRFRNPLAEFRKDMPYGNTIQQIACKWGKAHSYKDDAEDLLRYERPEFMTAFVSTDRWDKYKVSITRPEIRQALAQDGYGLNELIDSAVTANCINPEAYDEMNIMLQLFAEHNAKHGIFAHQLSAAPTDKATAQELLAAVKRYVNQIQFPSTLYNAQDVDGIPTFVNSERDCIILATPEVLSVLDVYAFAELFNVDRSEVRSRVIMVPELPFPNCYAILTTPEIFLCANSERGMYDFWDPSTLSTHSFYQVIGQYGINPFAPCIKFTTDAGSTVPTVTQSVTGVTVTPAAATVAPGETVAFTVTLDGSLTGTDAGAFEVKPDAVTWTITAANEDDEAIALNTRTYIDRFGVLHVQKSGLVAGDVITVVGKAAYINPTTGAASELTDDATITIA